MLFSLIALCGRITPLESGGSLLCLLVIFAVTKFNFKVETAKTSLFETNKAKSKDNFVQSLF